MKKLKSLSLLLFGFAFIFVACSDDDDHDPMPPVVAIENISNKIAMPQGESLSFKANIKSALSSSFKWMLDGVQASTDSTYVFTTDNIGEYTIMLVCENADGQANATVEISVYDKSEIFIENLSGETAMAQGESLSFKANIKTTLSTSSFKWMLDDEEVSTDSTYVFSTDEMGNYTIALIYQDADGEKKATVDVSVYGQFKNGVFVLNEGNMTSENGSLIFISPSGKVMDKAYFTINGMGLGNSTQDLFIGNGKMYIIAQNGKTSTGDNEGKLVIADAETLKKEASYNDELSTLSWPTHIAAIGDHAFIRDNNGIYIFNTTTKSISFINGTKGALKNRMAVANNKVFAPASKSVLVLESGNNEVVHKIEFDATVSGVIKSSDGNIWVSTTGSPQKIMKVNSSNYSIIQTNEMPAEAKLGAGWGATPGISAKGDTLYFSNAGTNIYRHIFNQNKTDFMVDVKTMVDDANTVYNNLGVHPVTGEVYFNTIKGYGTNYLINNISVFNFEESVPKLSANYKDYTHFPAGIFFTDYFK